LRIIASVKTFRGQCNSATSGCKRMHQVQVVRPSTVDNGIHIAFDYQPD